MLVKDYRIGMIIVRSAESIEAAVVLQALRSPTFSHKSSEKVLTLSLSPVRDRKTVLWSLLLPICTICLVMTILKINIDPSARTMLLDLSVPPQTDPISALNLPPGLVACTGSDLYTDQESFCRGSYAFQARTNGSDSYDMNKILLAVRPRPFIALCLQIGLGIAGFSLDLARLPVP